MKTRFLFQRARSGAAAAVVVALVHIAAPALAMDDIFSAQQDAVENPGGGTKVVTPIKDCLDKLPPEEAEAVRRNYLKPYQECIMRLRAFEARGGHKAAAAAATNGKDGAPAEGGKEQADKPAENARNFVRVRPDDGPRLPAQSYGATPEPAAPATPARPAWDSGYNR